MLWRPTNFEKHSSLRRMATIAVLFLQSFALRIAIGLYFAVISIFVLIFVLICVLPLSLWADSTFAGRNDVVLAAFLVCLLPTLAAAMFVASKLEQRRIRHEIASWVSARSNLIVANGYQQWEQRAKRWSLWVPIFISLVICLFFPETDAMLSHALHPKAGKLLGHEVQIPITWIVIHEGTNPAIRFSVVNAWTAKGYARNWRHETLFTEVSLVSRLPEPGDAAIQPPTHAKIISTRTLSSGGTAMTCWEYIPDYIDWGMW